VLASPERLVLSWRHYSPSLVYTIIEWFSHWSKLRLYLVALPSSTDWPWVLLWSLVKWHSLLSSLSSHTKNSVNDLSFGQTLVALSEWILDPENHKFGLSKLLAATWIDTVKRQLIALLIPSGILPCYFVLWIDIFKRQFIALLNPKAKHRHPAH